MSQANFGTWGVGISAVSSRACRSCSQSGYRANSDDGQAFSDQMAEGLRQGYMPGPNPIRAGGCLAAHLAAAGDQKVDV